MPKPRRRATGDPATPDAAGPEERRAKARESALRLLAVRERSATELRSRLRRKGFEPDLVESVIERLQETGLQDDARFAEQFAAEAARARGFAGRRIQAELRARGIERELAASAGTEHPDAEVARARALAERKAATMGNLPPEARARRIAAMLARRGYDPETCTSIAEEIRELPSGRG